jgi:protease I
MTLWPSRHTDLANADTNWEGKSVIVDGSLVTSRNPNDPPDCRRDVINLFGAKRAQQAA